MRFLWLFALAMSTLIGVNAVLAQPRDEADLRAKASSLFNDGNFREALDGYRQLCQDPQTAPDKVASDLHQAVECLKRLGLLKDLDQLLETTIDAHNKTPHLLSAAAWQYEHIPHFGFVIAGKFERGQHRGGGTMANVVERDRVRSLQLIRRAIALAADQDIAPAERGQMHLELADYLLTNAGGMAAWRLQTLTDLESLPEYDEGYSPHHRGAVSGAPVDAEGQPVFHHIVEQWEQAETDGQRWRWALETAAQLRPQFKNLVREKHAAFLHQQFGVQTMQQFGAWSARGAGDDEQTQTGILTLHTLNEDETIARLATGVKRFPLPDEFNFIKIYQQIADDPATGKGDDALIQLATIFENRRQYPRAAEYLKQVLERYGEKDWLRRRLEQITDSWGQFELHDTQPHGRGATVEFRYRNGKQVEFEAHEIDVARLLADVKDYLKSNPQNLEWEKLNIADIGWRLVEKQQGQYLSREAARWNLDLDPLPDHFDRRITVTTPLQKSGAYLVTARMKDGNTCKTILWVADGVVTYKPLNQGHLYYVADAASGKPRGNTTVEFFGYQIKQRRNGSPQIRTTNFAHKTNSQGLITLKASQLNQEYQWVVIQHSGDGQLAYLGFQHAWPQMYYDPHYEETKAFAITDRPVYRPGQDVQFKMWLAKSQYDHEGKSPHAGQSVPVEIHNPRGEKVYESRLVADQYGGIHGTLKLPASAVLGVYYFQLPGFGATPSTSFRVEEYKKPEFEVTVEAPKQPVMLGEKITADVRANYYFGAPVTNATVHCKVTRSEYADDWYPIMPWDWCYGRGYWWFAYDYTWYPGWHQWAGCVRPLGSWWPRPAAPPEIVAEFDATVDPDGSVKVEIDTSIAQQMHGDTDHQYEIVAEVRDQSRRTIVGQGKVLVARKAFKIYTWLDRGYYRVGDTIEASFLAQTLDRQGVEGRGQVQLLKIGYDDQGLPHETPVADWELSTDPDGRASLKIEASEKGQYRLAMTLADAAGHTIEGGYIFTIMGDGFDGAAFRFNHLEVIPDRTDYQPGDKVRLQINTDRVDSTVLLFVRPSNGVYLSPQVLRLDGKTQIVELDVVKKDMPNFFVEALTIADGKIYEEVKELVVPPEKRILNVEVLPSNREYKPGEQATMEVKVTDFHGENFVGSLAAAVYDKAVEYVSGGSNVPDIKEYFWKWRRDHHPVHESSLKQYLHNLTLPNEIAMQAIGIFGHSVADLPGDLPMAPGGGAFGGSVRRSMSRFEADGMMMAAPMAAMEASAEGEAAAKTAAGGPAAVEPTVRANFADTAFWSGDLQTNREGVAQITLTMPENLTTWKVKLWGIGSGTRVGEGAAEVITRKNLILRMQTPRFAVQNDELLLTANVHNYLPAEKQVRVTFQSDGDLLSLLTNSEETITIPADGEARVDFRVRVTREGLATVRMKALTDEESDAMQLTFPCDIHGILKTESWAGTVRPDQPSTQLTFTVPDQRRAEDTVLQIRYSPTLAGAMVDALPYLIDYPYGCTEQTLNRFLPAAITQKILIEMNLDLAAIREKRTNLNAQEIGNPDQRAEQWKRYDAEAVFDPVVLDDVVRQSVERLTNMQNSDGGWGWFSGWGGSSYPHTTAVVVRGLLVAQSNDVAIVPDVLQRGVQWLAAYQTEQLQRIRNADGKVDPWKPHADELDALVLATLVQAGVQSDEVAEMSQLLYRDRNEISVYAKAMLGLAMHQRQENERVAMLMRNIEQYLVEDPENQTAYLRLPSEGYWWYWYGDEIETHAAYLKLLAAHDPQGQKAPRLVKYLLNNRKHATYWRSTRDTALCVEAFADYLRATGETRPDMTVEVWLDGKKQKEVQIDAENLFSFDSELVLKGEEVTSGEHTLEIRRRGTGPVYFNAYLTNFTLEDPIEKAGLEIKVQRRYYRLERDDKQEDRPSDRGQPLQARVEHYRRIPLEDIDALKSGELVEIELEIESKNDYEYVMFEDRKAAGLEPVQVQSGYTAGGLGAYMELRDDRVTFFLRSLPRGRHSMAYRMRAEIPGRFSALPTQASAMYAPELRGNSDEVKVKIED